MRLQYPVSFLKLLLTGFALGAALPPALALLGAFFSLDQLGQRSAEAISRATLITRDSRALSEHITGLERLARQQLVLNDQAGIDAYARRRSALLELIGAAGASRGGVGDQRRAGAPAIGGANRLAGIASQTTCQPWISKPLLASSGAMNERAGRIVAQADASIEKDIATLHANAAGRARQSLLLAGRIAGGGLADHRHASPTASAVRQLEAGIRRLGEGNFDEGIRVDGPRDFVALGQRLDWLRQRLRELDEQKTRLLHHVSHELKTPLTALQEGSALLSQKATGPLNADQSEVVRILRSNCQRLRQLIENLLDYSSIRFQRAPCGANHWHSTR